VIYFVDEDFSAFGAWFAELALRGFETESLWNADQALAVLSAIAPQEVELVLIDVMLAVEDPRTSRYGADTTDDYLETGLRLLEDLSTENPSVFPHRAVLLTNTTNHETEQAAKTTSRDLEVPLWKKATIYSPFGFADRVEEHLASLAGA
jgi:hypothetical protein